MSNYSFRFQVISLRLSESALEPQTCVGKLLHLELYLLTYRSNIQYLALQQLNEQSANTKASGAFHESIACAPL